MMMTETKNRKDTGDGTGFASKTDFSPQKYSLNLGDQIRTLNDEFEKFENLAKNPFALTNIFLGLKTSLDNFNSLLTELTGVIKSLDQRVATIEQTITRSKEIVPTLSERDQEIYDYVMSKSRVCAEDLQARFKYKGKHAASARLNRLFNMGLLDKAQSGRTVFYMRKLG